MYIYLMLVSTLAPLYFPPVFSAYLTQLGMYARRYIYTYDLLLI